ncbi:hypothetical protein [Thalassotalea mangrovi]|uniref:Uncharacterized protein n=1 Tax=Thalassotalea mangrovi TaxID=2572245 RepID=A0A4U1B1N0_9GAMM|nr:hypothetical protein [Thalassotalea mangrovi]TKB43347.1 hypothetical protein E8M12_15240 [Thalassotalea mangrovi]
MYKYLIAAVVSATIATAASANTAHVVTGDMTPDARLASLYDVTVHSVKKDQQPVCWISAERDGKTITTARVEPSKAAYKRDVLKACVNRDEMFELIQQAK